MALNGGYRPRELARRRDAEVVRAEPLDQTRRMVALGTEVLAGPRRWELLSQARRAEQRGEVRLIQADPRWNAQYGEWQIRVVRIKPAAPAWRRPVLLTLAIGTPVVVLLALLYWLLTALAAAPLAAFCGFALVALAVVVSRGRRPHVTITQRIDIR